MKKRINIVILSIIILLSLFYVIEFSIYKINAIIISKNKDKAYIKKFSHKISYTQDIVMGENYYNGDIDKYMGRLPIGTTYNKNGIIIFGTSYLYCQSLKDEDCISGILSKTLKRPVYNRAIPGGGFTQMYSQVLKDSFYDSVVDADTVICDFLWLSYDRILLDCSINSIYYFTSFKYKNGELIETNYKNPYLNFIKATYMYRLWKNIWAHKKISNPKNAQELTDLALIYFIKTRQQLEKRYNHKINFIVLFYESLYIPYENLMIKKLKDNGFTVITTNSLTSENLGSEKYLSVENFHPTAATWHLLTPKIKEYIDIN